MTKNPYVARLTRFVGHDTMVTIQRADCGDLVGQVKKVDDQGCLILLAIDGMKTYGGRLSIFVALKDIRGVGHVPVQ